MSKILNFIKFTAAICGGWWTTMSGAASIPLAALALFLGGPARIWFAVLAFVGLLVFAIGVVRKNYALIKAMESESANQDQNHKAELARLTSEHTKQMHGLEQEITTLKNKLADRGSMRANAEKLAGYLPQLRARIDAIKAMPCGITWVDSLREFDEADNNSQSFVKAAQGASDKESVNLIEEVGNEIGNLLGCAQKQLYLSATEETTTYSSEEKSLLDTCEGRRSGILDGLERCKSHLESVIRKITYDPQRG